MKLLIPILTLLAICCLSFSFAQCSDVDDIVAPKKNSMLIGADDEGILILKKDSIPSGAKKIGSVREINGMRYDCDYDRTLEAVCAKAYDMGGNAIVLTHVKEPGGLANCFKIWADVYTVPVVNGEDNIKRRAARYDSLIHILVPENAGYSLIYVYRPYSSRGQLIKFNLHMNGEKITRIANNTMGVIRITKPGPATFWARTEAKSEQKLNMEMGKIYFLRCTLSMEAVAEEPNIDLVDPSVGFHDLDFIDMQETATDVLNK